MPARTWLLASAALLLVVLAQNVRPPALAQSTAHDAALSGIVSSAEEGAMEGVLVSARKAGSKVTTTVVSDREGALPVSTRPARAGRIHGRASARSDTRCSDASVTVRAEQSAAADLKLRRRATSPPS